MHKWGAKNRQENGFYPRRRGWSYKGGSLTQIRQTSSQYTKTFGETQLKLRLKFHPSMLVTLWDTQIRYTTRWWRWWIQIKMIQISSSKQLSYWEEIQWYLLKSSKRQGMCHILGQFQFTQRNIKTNQRISHKEKPRTSFFHNCYQIYNRN